MKEYYAIGAYIYSLQEHKQMCATPQHRSAHYAHTRTQYAHTDTSRQHIHHIQVSHRVVAKLLQAALISTELITISMHRVFSYKLKGSNQR